MSAEEGLLNFGKSAVISTVTHFVSGGIDVGIGNEVVNSMANGALNQAVNNAVAGTVNGFYIENGEFGWNGDALADSLFGKNALAGYAAGMAALLTSHALGKFNSQDWNKNALSGDLVNTASLAAFNEAAANLVAAGIEYGITGETTFNLLSIGDIYSAFKGDNETPSGRGPKSSQGAEIFPARLATRTHKRKDVGLFELHLTNKGISGKLGSAGRKVDWGNIMSSLEGLGETLNVAKFKLGGEKGNSTLAAANGLAWTDNSRQALARELFEGGVKAKYEEMAEGKMGYFDSDISDNTLFINSDYLGRGTEKAAKLASIFAHEGSHMAGNNIEGLAYLYQKNTYSQIGKIWNVMDSNFMADINKQVMNLDNWQVSKDARQYAELKTLTGGEFQNDQNGVNWNTPLGFADTLEEVRAINEAKKDEAWNSYLEKEFSVSGLEESDRVNFSPEITEDDFKNRLLTDNNFADEYNFDLTLPENIYRVACKMYTAMYAAEALTGQNFNGIDVNRKLKDNNVFADKNMLYHEQYDNVQSSSQFT